MDNVLKTENCQLNGKKLIWVQHTKKGHKQNLKIFSQKSFLSVAGKIFERILYNNIYEFFTEINLRSPNHSSI